MNLPVVTTGFQPPPLDAEALQHLLSMHGFMPEDRAAVRAFGRVIGRNELEEAFLRDFLARATDPSLPAAAAAEAEFCNILLDVCSWNGGPEWFNELASRWCACRDVGVGESFVWMCTGAMLSACRERLVGGRAEIFQLELDLLTGITRTVWALSAHLATVANLRERTLAKIESEGLNVSGVGGRATFDHTLAQLSETADEFSRLGLMVIRLHAAPAREVLMPEKREEIHTALQNGWRHVLRREDVLCYVGDSEWTLLQPGVRSKAQVLLGANKLREVAHGALARIDMDEGFELLIGGACAPDHGNSAEALERAARDAMNAGSRTHHAITMYGDSVKNALLAENEVEREFLRAIHLQRFELYLQPQVRVGDGQCDAAEALLRWQRADGCWVPPPTVFEIAGRLNQQARLTRLLVARVARMADELARSGVPVKIALNLTATDVHDPELPDLIEQSMANWRVPTGRLGVELTEGAILSDKPVVESVLSRLRAMGITIALDDFGTGYSSLAHLRRLPVSELKIDRQFVWGMNEDAQDMAIIQAVLALAKALNLDTVAEGVETAEQADTLRGLGCDRLQGMWISPAIPLAKFVTWWLARQQTLSLTQG